jgi:hypothetical protein
MTGIKPYSITLTRSYNADPAAIMDLFRNNTVFELTGANEIQSDFKTGGTFRLTFNNRGIIYGIFTKISEDEIILDWNVEGFQRPAEINTTVEINLRKDHANCILIFNHKNIAHVEAANAKEKAWTKIFDNIEKRIKSKK